MFPADAPGRETGGKDKPEPIFRPRIRADLDYKMGRPRLQNPSPAPAKGSDFATVPDILGNTG